MATNKAIALCRVSTSKQRIEGSSLQAQEQRVRDAASFIDAEIVKYWSLDVSSRKGKNYLRPDLHEMLAYAKQDKKIVFIIVDEADRFMRSIDEFYYWKLRFKQEAGATLVYAAKPELAFKNDVYGAFEEMIDVFKAEASNHKRTTKTTDKMQAKIKAGYYPGMVHQGYQTSDIPSLHIPKQPQWSLLKEAMHSILYKSMSLSESLIWLNDNGYRLQGGGKLDMYKLRHILKQPYYAGIIKMSNWEACPKGLHTAMITPEEYERLMEIVSGKRKKFTVHKYNPLFPASNIAECSDCVAEGQKETRLVGYRHHNNKPEHTRRFYERYRCRGCGKNCLKDTLHDGISRVLDKTELIVDDKGMFIEAMNKVWQADVGDSLQTVRRLKQKLTTLNEEKDNLVRSIAKNPELASDFKGTIVNIKAEITSVEDQIAQAENIHEDFDGFMAFAVDYVEHLKDNWWSAKDPDERIRLKELLYIDGFQISRAGKVLTPSLSPIYRYKMKKETKNVVSDSANASIGGGLRK